MPVQSSYFELDVALCAADRALQRALESARVRELPELESALRRIPVAKGQLKAINVSLFDEPPENFEAAFPKSTVCNLSVGHEDPFPEAVMPAILLPKYGHENVAKFGSNIRWAECLRGQVGGRFGFFSS